jgi:dynein heavy chain
MKFLRFSYLVDFLAMNSLKNIYNSSVDELKNFLRVKVEETDIFLLKENVKEIKSIIEPLFNVTLSHDIRDVKYQFREKIEAFLLPPSGTHTIADFKMIGHVTLKIPRKDKSSKIVDDDSDY